MKPTKPELLAAPKTKLISDFTDLELSIILGQTFGELELAKSKLNTVQSEISRRTALVEKK